MSFIDTWKEWGKGKKIASILGVCCILIIIVAVLGGFGSSDVNTSSSSSSDSSQADVPALQLKVITDGEWDGSVLVGSTSKSIDGSGTETIALDGSSFDMVSATIQKKSGGSDDLTVQIIKNGEVKKEESTSAEYGVVSIVD